jgi:hypothetical protein
VLTVYIGAAMFVVLACTGASLSRLATVRIRHLWLLWAALLDQIVIISIIPSSNEIGLAVAHIASYAAAGFCLVANRRLPGMLLLGAGGALNGLVITLNGGTLPASASALRAAGRQPVAGEFTNSDVLANPRLPWFGDVFATPAWLPGHNVFSIGDVAIWCGIAWFLWRTCRPGSPATPPPPSVGRHRLDVAVAAHHAAGREFVTVEVLGVRRITEGNVSAGVPRHHKRAEISST